MGAGERRLEAAAAAGLQQHTLPQRAGTTARGPAAESPLRPHPAGSSAVAKTRPASLPRYAARSPRAALRIRLVGAAVLLDPMVMSSTSRCATPQRPQPPPTLLPPQPPGRCPTARRSGTTAPLPVVQETHPCSVRTWRRRLPPRGDAHLICRSAPDPPRPPASRKSVCNIGDPMCPT